MAVLPDTFAPSNGGGVLPDWLKQALAGAQQPPPQPSYNPIGQDFSQFQNAGQSNPLSALFAQQGMGAPGGGGQQPPPMPPPINIPAPPQPGPPMAAPAQMAPPQPAAQAAPASPQMPGIGDRLNAGLMGFANSGAPLPAIANLITGLVTGQRADPVGYQQQIMKATYDAALKGGASEADARMIAVNPTAWKDLFERQKSERELKLKETEGKIVPFGASMVSRTGQPLFGGENQNFVLDEPTLKAMAEQYRAGDTTVMQNLGRGAQGAENIVKLRKEITRQLNEAGISGAGQAMTNAEFFGVKSGQRTLGNKQANIELAANEFKQVLPIVVTASNAVNRTSYPDLNKIIQMANEKTGDPNIVKFGSGVNTLVNLYARAISPTGAPTVSDKDHARVLLNRAWSQGQFNAAVDMMTQEIEAALKSPEAVRNEQRKRFLGGQPGGTSAPTGGGNAPDPLGIR